MPLSIRNPEADALARLEDTKVTDAASAAPRERESIRESPGDAALRILARRGLRFPKDRRPVPPEAWRDLDSDLTDEG